MTSRGFQPINFPDLEEGPPVFTEDDWANIAQEIGYLIPYEEHRGMFVKALLDQLLKPYRSPDPNVRYLSPDAEDSYRYLRRRLGWLFPEIPYSSDHPVPIEFDTYHEAWREAGSPSSWPSRDTAEIEPAPGAGGHEPSRDTGVGPGIGGRWDASQGRWVGG